MWEKERYVYTIYIIYYIKIDSCRRERKIERETGVGEKGRKRDMVGDRKLGKKTAVGVRDRKRDRGGREKDRKRDRVGEIYIEREIGVGERKRDREMGGREKDNKRDRSGGKEILRVREKLGWVKERETDIKKDSGGVREKE